MLMFDDFLLMSIEKKWKDFDIEVPSWGLGRGGTRFGAYPAKTDPRTPAERIAKAAKFHELTGKGERVALHFPWDCESRTDAKALGEMLSGYNLKAGAINANFFSPRGKKMDNRLRFGGLISPFSDIRRACMDHVVECIDYMRLLGSNALVLWLPDGINSPGQMSLYEMTDKLDAAFANIAKLLKPDEKMMIEYKPFEPAFYASAVPDWGSALGFCQRAGSNASVLVDLGHHLPGANVEQVVMHLIWAGRLGGFHFNDRKYADDDLASGSIDPAGLFRIFANLVEAENRNLMPLSGIAFMIDESHNIKDPLEEMVESLLNIETALIKALIVDWEKLRSAMDAADPVWADAILRDAFLTDVRPVLERFRSDRELPPDPLKAAIAGRS